MNKRFTGLLLATALMFIGCRTQPQTASLPIDDARRQQHLAAFDQVWTTIQEQHWDPTLNGVDWTAARDELRPRVAEAKTDGEARAAMNDLIARLKQSHFGIIPAEAYARVENLPRRDGDDGKPATGGESGLHVRVVDGEALITQVEPASAGEAAGVKPGWIVSKVGKFEVEDVLKRINEAYRDTNARMLPTYQMMAVAGLLSGGLGERLQVSLIDDAGKTVRKELELLAPSGKPAKFGNLPTFYLRTDVREAAPGIGYIAFNAFFDPPTVSVQFRDAIERFQKADGLIIDLRGNPGGIGFMANGMAGSLIAQPGTKLGTMSMRSGEIKFVINPQAIVFNGPVAVLVDEGSMSTSEIMAGGLQDLGRARVFGTQTPGAALPSRIEKLPNGDGFQYAFANYVSEKESVLEGHGVTPDQSVAPNRQSLLKGQDNVIEAAIEWIRSQKEAS